MSHGPKRATAAKSNEKSAIAELLVTLALEGCIVTLDAMGTQSNIAQAIRRRGANYIVPLDEPMKLHVRIASHSGFLINCAVHAYRKIFR